METNTQKKTSINLVWVINYAKWGEKTLKKIIKNFESEKQGLKTEELKITDIIPNHGENQENWNDNVFYVQNVISWGMKFPENPVKVFTAFANSASLVSFAKNITKIKNSERLLERYFEKKNRLEEDIEDKFKEKEKLLLKLQQNINSDDQEKIENTENDIEIKEEEIKRYQNDLNSNLEEIEKMQKFMQDSEEYKDYIQNKELYDNFVNQADEITKRRDFQDNLENNNKFDHEKINKLLIEFIQKKYNTDISLERIQEKYKKTFQSFEKEFQIHNQKFEILDFKDAVQKDEQAKKDLIYYKNNRDSLQNIIFEYKNNTKFIKDDRDNEHIKNPFLKSRALNLLLNDEIFDMVNFVDTMKIMVSNYFSPSLMIDMDITPSVFVDAENLILKNLNKISSEKDKIENQEFDQDVVYFGGRFDPYSQIGGLENQVCYTGSKNHEAFDMLFNKILDYNQRNQDYIFRAIRDVAIKSNGDRRSHIYKKIDQLAMNELRMYSVFTSGISDFSKAPMNQTKNQEERDYEFKENWIQDGLKFDVNNPKSNIELVDFNEIINLNKKPQSNENLISK